MVIFGAVWTFVRTPSVRLYVPSLEIAERHEKGDVLLFEGRGLVFFCGTYELKKWRHTLDLLARGVCDGNCPYRDCYHNIQRQEEYEKRIINEREV